MTPDPYDHVRAAFHTVADGLMGWEDPPERAERRSHAPLDVPPTPDIAALEAAAEVPEWVTREHVQEIEAAGEALMRHKDPENAVGLFAIALRWQVGIEEREKRRDRREKIQGKSKRGAWAESVAVSFLIEEGYEVFRNVAHTGPIDLVAVSAEGETTLIDVKSTLPRKSPDLPRYGAQPSDAQRKLGVRYLYVDPNGTCRWEAP